MQPENANTLFNLGFIYQKQSKHADAIATFDAATQINPTLDRAWFGRGMSRAALELHEQAISDFERAAKLQPLNPHALYELGMQHYALNNPEKVVEVIERLRRFDPKATRQLMQATHTILDVKQS